MRKELASKIGERGTYIATFSRNGIKNGYKGIVRTVLLTNLKDHLGKVVTNHLWMTEGKQLARLNLKPGDVIQFEGRVDTYIKGYRGYRDDVYDAPIEEDYRLVYPTKFKKIIEVEQNI
jgi:hypothetical protein